MREDVFYRMKREGFEEGREEGRKFERLVNARAMLASGIPSRQVADILNLSEKDMKEGIPIIFFQKLLHICSLTALN